MNWYVYLWALALSSSHNQLAHFLRASEATSHLLEYSQRQRVAYQGPTAHLDFAGLTKIHIISSGMTEQYITRAVEIHWTTEAQ